MDTLYSCLDFRASPFAQIGAGGGKGEGGDGSRTGISRGGLQGLSMDNAMRFLPASTSRTQTLMRSPTLTTSDGCRT